MPEDEGDHHGGALAVRAGHAQADQEEGQEQRDR